MPGQGLDVMQGDATPDGILRGCTPETVQADAL
jgi:hypothetical protein